MSKSFKRIGLFGRTGTQHVNETLISLIEYLLDKNCSICIELETATSLNHNSLQLPIIPKEQLSAHCDLLIVIGGDGSLLHAAHIAVNQKLPVLGINRGNLGFLTDILPTAFSKVTDILQGNYKTEERFLITAEINSYKNNSNNSNINNYALNEIAIMPDSFPHMLEFEIYINNEFVCSQHADGIIIATPTGSTAYALSGGGPILHPVLDAIVLVPMFPHSLNNRPIVIDGNSKINIIISKNSATNSRLSCDGRPCIGLAENDQITIQKKPQPLLLIHPNDYSYYEALRSKLYWGKKLGV